MGLGSFPTVSLADARKRATAHRNTLTEGKDPLYAKKQDLIKQKLKEFESMTFMQCAETYIDIHKANPEERTKMKRPHRVPLTDGMMAILRAMEQIRNNEYLFPGQKQSKPISNMAILKLLKRMDRRDITVHGFRSTFRDWAAETTDFSGDVVEMALAHKIQNDIEAAYRRGDLLKKHRTLMIEWNNYCCKS